MRFLEPRTCWECDNCGWQVLDPQISLEDAVCLCGVGAGRWRVSTVRTEVPPLTARRAKEVRDELCRRIDDLEAEKHLDEHAGESLSGIVEWLDAFDDREPGEGFEIRSLCPFELLPQIYPRPGTIRS